MFCLILTVIQSHLCHGSDVRSRIEKELDFSTNWDTGSAAMLPTFLRKIRMLHIVDLAVAGATVGLIPILKI